RPPATPTQPPRSMLTLSSFPAIVDCGAGVARAALQSGCRRIGTPQRGWAILCEAKRGFSMIGCSDARNHREPTPEYRGGPPILLTFALSHLLPFPLLPRRYNRDAPGKRYRLRSASHGLLAAASDAAKQDLRCPTSSACCPATASDRR